MGCDIHMCFEVMDRRGEWVSAELMCVSPWDDAVLSISEVYTDRHYNLFSALCGVRSYNNEPKISDPKGLPEDVSSITKGRSEYWGDDGHSHSWNTLAELEAANLEPLGPLIAAIRYQMDRVRVHMITGWDSSVPIEERVRVVYWFDN